MRVSFLKRSVFEEEQDILFDPELQTANWQQDSLGRAVCRRTPIFAEASRDSHYYFPGVESVFTRSYWNSWPW
jgi:hypothetical protein